MNGGADDAIDTGWKLKIGLLTTTHVAGTLNITSVMAMAPVVRADLGLSVLEYGSLITAYYTAQACFSLPSGTLTDRLGVGRAIVLSHFLMAVAALAASQVNSLIMAQAVLFLMGAGYSFTNPSTAKGVLIWFPRDQRGTALGFKQTGVPIGGVLGAANGALAAFYDWRLLMLGVAAVMILNGLLCLKLVRESRPDPTDRPGLKDLFEVIRDRNLSIYVFCDGLINTGQTNFNSFLTIAAREVVGTSQQLAGGAKAVAEVTSAVSRFLTGWASDRFFDGGRRPLMAWMSVLAAVFLLGMAALQDGSPVWWVFALAVLLGATATAVAPLAQAIAVEAVAERQAGSAAGYNMMGVHIGGATAPLVFGWAADTYGMQQAAWIATAVLAGLGAIILIVWVKEGHNAARR